LTIKVSEIDDISVVKGTMDGSHHAGPEDEGFRFLSPVVYELTLRKFENGLHISGPVSCELNLICVRCLEEVPFSVNTFLDVELAPKDLVPHSAEVELKGNDLDTDFYEGDEIDLDPLVYEEVLLNLPMSPLCRDDCKGLCDTCGKNKNYGACSCSKASNTLLAEKLKAFLS
jgi:uncharacterized protein